MVVSLKWLLLLTLTGINAQEPRKRNTNERFSLEEPIFLEQNDEDVSCAIGGCVKRSPGQDEFGPFWANRGKKDPTYSRSKLYVDEPHWILVRRDDTNGPFYVARGKKSFNESNPKSITAQFWKNLLGGNASKKFKYLEPLLQTGRKNGNFERSGDFQ